LKPTRYQFPPDSFAQGEDDKEPLKLDEYGEPIHLISYLVKYDHKKHAWVGDYYNFNEFDAETEDPTDYLKDLGALAQ
jgi:hypothetical protein